MLNYVRAELYKVMHRKYPYILLAAMLFCEVALAAFFAWFNTQIDIGDHRFYFDDWLSISVPLLTIGIYMGTIICDIVFSEQYKHNTLKNEVSFGISRTRVYLGKLATQAIVGIVLFVILAATAVLFGAIALPHGAGVALALQQTGYAALAVIPLCIGSMSFANMLSFLLKSATAGSFIQVVILISGGNIFSVLQLVPVPAVRTVAAAIHSGLLLTPYEQMVLETMNFQQLGYAWLVGMGWLVVTSLLGIALFHRREIS